MTIYKWNGVGDYDYFLECSENEAMHIFQDWEKNKSASFDQNTFYYFINIGRKAIAPLPQLSLAFGGQYNGYPPYGKAVSFKNPIQKLSAYTTEEFLGWNIRKNNRKKKNFLQDYITRFL